MEKRFYKYKLLQCHLGYTLSQMLVGITISGILMVSGAKVITTIYMTNFQNNVVLVLKQLKAEAYVQIIFPNSWEKTLADPQNLGNGFFADCMVGDNDDDIDCQNRRGILILKDNTNELFFTHENENTGFGLSGSPCDSFGVAGREFECPFRMEVFWKTYCLNPAAACLVPLREVQVQFRIDHGPDRNSHMMSRNFGGLVETGLSPINFVVKK